MVILITQVTDWFLATFASLCEKSFREGAKTDKWVRVCFPPPVKAAVLRGA